jgi:hypothetical protein
MATITSQLTLSGSGVTSDQLEITQSVTFNVTLPVVESGTLNVTATPTDLVPANPSRVYLYVKNTGTLGTSDNVNIQTAAAVNIAELAPTEWLFFPVEENLNLKVDAATASGTSTIEYSYFTAV